LNETSIFSTDFLEFKFFFSKIRPVGAKLFQAEGQTIMSNLIVDFRNFAKAPGKVPRNLIGSKMI